MMRIAVDLHIHSALSPCADDFMTPGNIVGMAYVNELDAIAITDHNCNKNADAAVAIGEEYDIVVIPGMELETSEEIHVVCLFADTATLEHFTEIVANSYPYCPNRPDIFGSQQIFDKRDMIIGEHDRLLLSPSGISIDDAIRIVDEMGGIAYPAHIDRDSYSVLACFGALPFDYPHNFAEISYDCDEELLCVKYPFLRNLHLIRASDAHYAEKTAERRTFIDVEERSAAGIIDALRRLPKKVLM